MDREKILNKLGSWLVFAYFAVFPFGQLLNLPLGIHLIDILVLLLAIIYLASPTAKLEIFKWPLMVLISLNIFSPIGEGALYLVRWLSYFLFMLEMGKLITVGALKANFIEHALFGSGVTVAVFGLIQYLLLPDLRAMRYFGWDDHYFRLVSTFFDPAFTGILLVLALILGMYLYYKHKRKQIIVLNFVLFAALALTYSRASFLALFVGLVAYLAKKHFKVTVVMSSLLLLMFFILPRSPGGEGVRLMRTSSVVGKISNFQESMQIISTSPLFGVGMNNICSVRLVLFSYPANSHACPGLDNSILFIAATTGILGLLTYLTITIKIYFIINKSAYGHLIVSMFIALLAHSMFTNTLFYPWVMGWMGAAVALGLSTSKK